jgi:uncharacterized protein (TIGR00299 family) protein
MGWCNHRDKHLKTLPKKYLITKIGSMRIIYFDCFSGVSGDMVLGALLDAGLQLPLLKKELAKISLKGYGLSKRVVTKQGFKGTKVDIVNSDKPLSAPQMISLIQKSKLEKTVKKEILNLIEKLINVELKAHNVKSAVHLHELGTIDTLVDIAGAIIGLRLLKVEKIYSSPLPIFRGFVNSAHGRIPLPAPATAELLKGFPIYYTELAEEIVTPTGALIITSLAKPSKEMPLMTINQIGYGAGEKDFPGRPNLLRVFIGEAQESHGSDSESKICILETNIDDLSPQIIGYLFEKLLKAGALDVWTVPIQMKKSRAGILLNVLIKEKDMKAIQGIIFAETTTFGIRHYPVYREILERRIKKVKTKYGAIRIKTGVLNGKLMSISPEYEDCRKISEKKNIPLKKIYQEAIDIYQKKNK